VLNKEDYVVGVGPIHLIVSLIPINPQSNINKHTRVTNKIEIQRQSHIEWKRSFNTTSSI